MISAPRGHLGVRGRIELDLVELPLRVGHPETRLHAAALPPDTTQPSSEIERQPIRPAHEISATTSPAGRCRFVNQLESGTSSTVLTFSARTSRRSPGVAEGVDDEVVAVGVLDRDDRRRVERHVVVDRERVVGVEARAWRRARRRGAAPAAAAATSAGTARQSPLRRCHRRRCRDACHRGCQRLRRRGGSCRRWC